MRKRAQYAGTWYPGDAAGCRREIITFLEGMDKTARDKTMAGIAPHAGWVYSGAIACRVVAALAGRRPDLIVVCGIHLAPHSPCSIAGQGAFETPLGDLYVDEQAAGVIAGACGLETVSARAFPQDNTIEVLLPFIRYFFPGAGLVPVGVPPNDLAERVGKAAVSAARAGGRRLAVLGSTDLTHYGAGFGFTPAGTGPDARLWMEKENDASAVSAMKNMDVKAILAQAASRHNMCCAGAAAATASAAREMGAARGRLLAYGNSQDLSPGDTMVGYAGILFSR